MQCQCTTKQGKQCKLPPQTQVGRDGRFCQIHQQCGNLWVEPASYIYPINLPTSQKQPCQCMAKTLNRPCKRTVEPGQMYCFQHQDCAQRVDGVGTSRGISPVPLPFAYSSSGAPVGVGLGPIPTPVLSPALPTAQVTSPPLPPPSLPHRPAPQRVPPFLPPRPRQAPIPERVPTKPVPAPSEPIPATPIPVPQPASLMGPFHEGKESFCELDYGLYGTLADKKNNATIVGTQHLLERYVTIAENKLGQWQTSAPIKLFLLPHDYQSAASIGDTTALQQALNACNQLPVRDPEQLHSVLLPLAAPFSLNIPPHIAADQAVAWLKEILQICLVLFQTRLYQREIWKRLSFVNQHILLRVDPTIRNQTDITMEHFIMNEEVPNVTRPVVYRWYTAGTFINNVKVNEWDDQKQEPKLNFGESFEVARNAVEENFFYQPEEPNNKYFAAMETNSDPIGQSFIRFITRFPPSQTIWLEGFLTVANVYECLLSFTETVLPHVTDSLERQTLQSFLLKWLDPEVDWTGITPTFIWADFIKTFPPPGKYV